MAVDYKELLFKYINHVGESEGCEFLSGGDPCDWYHSQKESCGFTAEELAAMKGEYQDQL